MAGRGGLGSLSVSLSLDSADFVDGLSKAEQQAKAFADQVKSIALGEAIGDAISSGAIKAYDALKEMTFGAIDAADHLNDLSKKTGIAVDTLGGIGFAAKNAGGDIESASAASGKLNRSLAEAASGNTKAAEAFKLLGISVTDSTGKTKDAGSALVEIAGKFASYEDGPEKAALALRIFGKAGADIIPLLDDGAASLERSIEFYKKYSGVTQEVADQADHFNDTLGFLNVISKGAGTTLAATLLPSFQNLLDAFLNLREQGNGFIGVAQAIKTVFDVLVEAAANVAFVFVGVGREIGGFAAQLVALGHLDFKGFNAIDKAVEADGVAARKTLDKFVEDFKAAGKTVVTPAPVVRAPAPRLAPSGKGDTASAELKKQLDGQIKLIEQFAKSQADGFAFANQLLAAQYQTGAFSQQEFFAAEKNVRDAALANQLQSIDKQITAEKAYASNPVVKQPDRIAAENKIKELVEQRSDAVTKANAADILSTVQNARATEQLADAYTSLLATVKEGQGDSFGAAQLRNATQIRDAQRLITQAGGDPKQADALKSVLAVQTQQAELQKQYGRLLDSSSNKEQQIALDAQSGGKTTLETLAAVRDARTAELSQLQALATQAQALAAVSSDPAVKKFADDLALAYKKAAAEVDPLAAAINSSLEDSLTSPLADFIKGTKSAKDAFKDFASSVINNISQIVAKDLAKSLFGDTGGSSGLGGLLSGLFKSSGSSSGAGASAASGGSSLGGLFSSFLSLFGGGAALATGTNYVPYDGFKATLHKGEAVVPARYNPGNPSATDASGGMGGALTVHNNFMLSGSVDARTQDQIAAAAARGVSRASARLN